MKVQKMQAQKTTPKKEQTKISTSLSLPARNAVINVIDLLIGRVDLEINACSDINKLVFFRLPFIRQLDIKTQGDFILTFDLLKKHRLFQNKFNFVGLSGIEKNDKKLKWEDFVTSLNEFKREILLSRKMSSDTIIKLTLILSKNEYEKKYKIVINEKYKSPIEVDSVKPSWQLLLKLAKDKYIQIENDSDKSAFDYLNSNKRCRLYTKTGYSVTKILRMERGYIKAEIPIETMTDRQYRQTLNKIGT